MDSGNNSLQAGEKRLGFFNRLLLSVAHLAQGISGIVREDSRKSRAAYWGYMGVIGAVTAVCIGLAFLPFPNVFGAALALSSASLFMGGIKALSASGLSQWAREKDKKYLRGMFNEKALMEKYDAFILPKEDKPGAFYVHKSALLRHVFKRAAADMHRASPGPVRRTAHFTKRHIAPPVMKGLSAFYNHVAAPALRFYNSLFHGPVQDEKKPENRSSELCAPEAPGPR